MDGRGPGWAAQDGYGVRLEWGAAGAAAIGRGAAALVIVDVLSFCTSVSVAADRGTAVYPFPWRDERAAAFAGERRAALAVGRADATTLNPWTLSPASLRAAPAPPRLVLPSPNGSAIAAAVTARRPPGSGDRPLVLAGCLRNAAAVGVHLADAGFGTAARPVAVVPAGERFADETLRPAVEDLLGAGAVVAALLDRRDADAAPEAVAAAACARHTRDIPAALAGSASGRELAERGFAADVEIAGELDASTAIPAMTAGAFTPLP